MNAITEKGRLLADEERLAPAHTALVLIDLQNDFCHPDGVFGKLGADLSMMPPLVEPTRALLDAARRKGMLIVFVRATYDDEVLSPPLAETYHRRGFLDSQCPEGSTGAGWYDGLAPNPAAANEIVVTKHRFSAFWGSDIDVYLRANGIQTLVFTGVVTSGCVESTLRDAFFRDYYVVAVRDCVAEASADRHEAALHKIEQAFGTVREARDIAAIWKRSNLAPPKLTRLAKLDRAMRDFRTRIDPAHCALVLIDLQRDYCSPEGIIGRTGEDLALITAALKQAAKLLAAARASGMQVIHVRTEHTDADASEVSVLACHPSDASCCRAGSAGVEFMPEAAPRAGEWVVTKRRYSAFVDTRLELLLRSNHIRSVLIAGVATECSVESTVRDASMRDFYVTVAREAIGTRGAMKHLHAPALETLSLYFADCRAIAEIIGALPAQSSAAAA